MKFKKAVMSEAARERAIQRQRLAKWLHYMFMQKFLEELLASFKACKRKHARLVKEGLIANYAWFAVRIKHTLKYRGDFGER